MKTDYETDGSFYSTTPDEVHGVRAEALRQLDPRDFAAQLDLLEGVGPRPAHPGLGGGWTGGQLNNAKYLLRLLRFRVSFKIFIN